MTKSNVTFHHAIRCQNLTKSFGSGATQTAAVKDVSIELPAGQITFLVGPSGCGKTTLVSLIGGILDPDKGEIDIFGTRLNDLSHAYAARFRSSRIGFILQNSNLFPSLTAIENAAVPVQVQGHARRHALERAALLLRDLEMSPHAMKFPDELSGGQQQRVAIARALIHNPQLVICDEPTAALDATAGQHVMKLLRQVALRADRAVIVVTHDERIFNHADRVATMSDGRISKVQEMSMRGAA